MRVLIVDDDIVTRQLLGAYCKKQKNDVTYAATGIEALEFLYKEEIDLVLTDIRMPNMDGKKLLQEIKSLAPGIPVLIMTAHSSIDEAVSLLKAGAEDYIPKPISADVFSHRLDSVLKRLQLAKELEALKANTPPSGALDSIVGTAPVVRALLKRLPMIAQTDAAVMINGESGTGKELVARAIHHLSKRQSNPFITVNCGALPDNLLESELFGYKKGAFTDAYQDTPGLVESASGGTLFLDEIGEMSSVVQVKLLRFTGKEYKQLGSPKPQKANVRLSALPTATCRRCRANIPRRLFYRLNIVPVVVPPKRTHHRRACFGESFESLFSGVQQIHQGFSTEVLRQLIAHKWPGNVRELENKIQQMVVLCEGDEISMKTVLQKLTSAGRPTLCLENFKAEKRESSTTSNAATSTC